MLLSSAAQGLAGAADGVAWQAWVQAGLFVLLAAVLGALLLVARDMRRLARDLDAVMKAAQERAGPLVDHATNAARNLDHVCRVAREGADRLEGSFSRIADEADKAAGHARARLGELAALADFVQAEAEDAVLDVATKVRMARNGAGLAQWLSRGGKTPADRDEREPPAAPPPGGDNVLAPPEGGMTDTAAAPLREAGGDVHASLPNSAPARPPDAAPQPEVPAAETGAGSRQADAI